MQFLNLRTLFFLARIIPHNLSQVVQFSEFQFRHLLNLLSELETKDQFLNSQISLQLLNLFENHQQHTKAYPG